MLPRTATQDAYSRLAPITQRQRDRAAARRRRRATRLLPFMDPAFAAAVCRYDLVDGPIKFTVPVSQAYTSVSFYTRNGVAYYAINDRAAGRRVIELDLMTPEQRAELPEDEEVTAADRLIVESPTPTGLIMIKALAPEPDSDAAGARLADGRDVPAAELIRRSVSGPSRFVEVH